MINKSLRAYITRAELEFLVLAHGEVVRGLFLQLIKHQVNAVFELFIILPDLHGIDNLHQCREVLFLFRSLIVDVAN